MTTNHRDRASSRATQYRQQIKAAQAEGDNVKALELAIGWLKGEAAKVRRRRPHEAATVDADLTDKVAELAEAIPFYRPQKPGRR